MSEKRDEVTLKNVRVVNYNATGPLRDVRFGRKASFRVEFDSEQESMLTNKFDTISEYVVASFAKGENRRKVVVPSPLKYPEDKTGNSKGYAELEFMFKNLSEKKTVSALEEIAKKYEEAGDSKKAEEITDLLVQKNGHSKALMQEIKHLKDLGLEDDANELIENCLTPNQFYFDDRKFVLPPIVEQKDGQYVSTFTSSKDGLEKPLYASFNDLVNISFKIIPTQGVNNKNTVYLKLKLLGVEIVDRNKKFTSTSNYTPPKTIDISGLDIEDDGDGLDFSKFKGNVQELPKSKKTEINTDVEVEKKEEVKEEIASDKKSKKTSTAKTKKEEAVVDETVFSDIDAMLAESEEEFTE